MIEKLKLQDVPGYPYISENGYSHESRKAFIQSEILHFCGCGDPDEAMTYVKNFLQKCKDHDWKENYNNTSLLFLCYWADHEGLTEHGSSIYCSWLTPKGEEVLNDINWCIENEKE